MPKRKKHRYALTCQKRDLMQELLKSEWRIKAEAN